MTFRIHNTVLTLRFGFFAVLAVLLTLDGGVHVLPALLAVAVHETGHILAAKLCGMQIKSVTFGALGIHMAGETASVGDFRRAVVSLAGPFANLLSFLLLLPLPSAYSAVQLTLFAFHVLPAVPLDGGTALYCLLRGTFSEKTAERTITVSSVLLGAYPRHARVFGFDFYGLQLHAFVFGGLHLILLNSETAGEHVLKFPRCSVIIK